MAKQKPEVTVRTYGIYSKWDSASKELPSFLELTTRIAAEVDVEFGLVINVKGGKNMPISYCIDHPGILDDDGKRRPPFEGVVYAKTNDWDFYLGDTIWEPVEDKYGLWRMTLEIEGQIVADQSFDLYSAEQHDLDDRTKAMPLRHQYRLLWIPGL